MTQLYQRILKNIWTMPIAIGMTISGAYNLGLYREHKKHETDYLKIDVVTTRGDEPQRTDVNVDANIGGKRVQMSRIGSMVKRAGLDKVLSENEIPALQKTAAERIGKDISRYTFGSSGGRNDDPNHWIDYTVATEYWKWAVEGANGYASRIELRPK